MRYIAIGPAWNEDVRQSDDSKILQLVADGETLVIDTQTGIMYMIDLLTTAVIPVLTDEKLNEMLCDE